jgi:deoxyribose-phosphate aldolase
MTDMNLADYIDHTNLKPEATIENIITLCNEAMKYHFAAVCINPGYVDLAAHLVKGTDVKVATVIGFPLGATLPEVKVYEAKEALVRKADELDMVINIGAAKAGQWQAVTNEIQEVVKIAEDKIVKVIIETCLLNDEEKKYACQAVLAAGAHFVKTSTGFSSGGATEHDVKLLRAIVGDRLKVKASGGIRTREQAELLIAAGADRLGTSAGVKIVK